MTEFWVPPSARPRWKCNICGAQFHEDERRERERHMARCVSEHHDQLVEALHEERPPAFFQPHDPEWAEHVWSNGGIKRTRRPRPA